MVVGYRSGCSCCCGGGGGRESLRGRKVSDGVLGGMEV